MSEKGKPLQPIIVKRIKKAAHAHHGGAWKIAYADFVTAMMAFFLLMWLLGSTTQGDLKGISEYFNTPLKVALTGGSGSGDSTSILKGGGKDISHETGQIKKTETKDKKPTEQEAAKAERGRQDQGKLMQLKRRIEDMVASSVTLRQYQNQIRLDITDDGLRIQIVDEQNRPMFDSGRAVVKDYTRDILREIGRALNDVEYRISLSGHTDAAAYGSGERGYSNWELSADRANAARRELIAAGTDDRKIMRVVGLAASVPFVAEDPLDARNRRISIIVMNRNAEEAILRPGSGLEAADAAPEAAASQQPAAAPGAPAPTAR
jgi:chemotaxis protein MotB